MVVAVAALAFGVAGSAQWSGDAAQGKDLSKKCAACHGANGEGKGKAPALAGKPEADLVKALQDFKSGAREGKMMNGFAKKLSDGDIANLAAYFNALE